MASERFERFNDLGRRRAGESEAEFVDRRGRESRIRWAEQDAAIEAHRRARTLIVGTALPAAPRAPGVMGRPRRGSGWAS